MFEWTLMKRLIWIKAAIISGAASLYETISGAIVSFVALHAKALKELVVNIEPVQDLHGYDAPWPPGGGVNKFNVADDTKTASGVTFTMDNNVLTVTGIAEAGYPNTTFPLSTPIPAGTHTIKYICNLNGKTRPALRVRYEGGGYYDMGNQDTAVLTHEAAITGFQASTNAGFEYDTTVSEIQIVEGSTAPAWSPYSNICPISGWTGCEVYRTGHNVWDEQTTRGYINSSTGVVAKNPEASTLITDNYIPIKEETEYIVSTTSPALTPNVRARFYDKDKVYLCYVDYSGSPVNYNTAFKTPSKACFLMIEFQAEYGTTYNHDISINYPATATGYHAYSGQEIDVAFPAEAGTVYGGTDEVIGGKLKSDLGEIDLGAQTWSSTGNNIFSCKPVNMKAPASYEERKQGIISSAYPVSNSVGIGATMDDKSMLRYDGNIYIRDTSFATPEEFKAGVSGVKLVYEFAEPQQFTHEGHEISTQVGTNNIWADAGDVEVTYYAK